MATDFTYKIEDKIAIVYIEDKNAPVNNWSTESELIFSEKIKEIKDYAERKEVEGVILISGKGETFLTGADLNALLESTTREEFDRDISLLQGILNELEALPIPTLAAVNGHCMGGGCELILACKYRIAKESPTTLIGLPETSLGLFPGGGGTSRLPRLIGYPGVEAILYAKNFTAAQAKEIGLIDKLVPENGDLLEEAKKYIKGLVSGDIVPERKVVDFSDKESKLKEIKEGLLKKRRGRILPAHTAVLKIVNDGVNLPLLDQQKIEKAEFLDVALSTEAQGSIHSFFLGNMSRAKKMIPKGFTPKEFRKVGVLGFGSMGRGIVIECLKYLDIPVVVKDNAETFEAGKAFVEKIIGGDIERGRFRGDLAKCMSKLVLVSEYENNFSEVDYLVEAIFEDKKVKQAVYQELTKHLPKDAIIVSNTSFLSINELQENVENPERFAGMHFFSPVFRMQLVEIIKGAKTSEETINNSLAFAAGIRKRPILCKDSPGFVVNAILDPLMTNGLALVEEGNSIEKVDGAMLSFGMPIGPIRLADEVGLDVSYHIFKERGIEQKTYENLYNAGRYGTKKVGKGLFLEDGSVDPEALQYIAAREEKIRSEEEIVSYFVTDMVKIAKKLLEDGVIDDPKYIDIGLIYGAGFPSDKGGPVKFADLTGISQELFGEKFYK